MAITGLLQTTETLVGQVVSVIREDGHAEDCNVVTNPTGDVVGPAVSVAGDIAVFNDTSGKVLADSGVAIGDVVTNPGTSTAGHLPAFADASGTLLTDSGVVAGDVVVNPAASTSGHLASFGDTSGTLIGDAGVVAADVVVNPAVAVAGNLASFSDASGNLIGDSGESPASLARVGIVTEATATRTLTAADAGKYIRCSGACVITVNTGVFTAGDPVFFRQVGAGAISFAGTATLTPPVTNAAVSGQQGGTIALIFDTANTADLCGDLQDL